MKKIITFCFLLTIICIKSWGQVSNYSFAASSGTYTTLINATTVSPTGTETLFTSSGDEGAYNNLPIGFSFYYGGTFYTSISASTNGFAVLGATFSTGDGFISGDVDDIYHINDLTGGTAVASSGVLAPLWDDLSMSSGSFSYLRSGTSGNYVFTMQWQNVIWPFGGNIAIDFQIKLYQATGAVQYIYQRETGTISGTSASIGIEYNVSAASSSVTLRSLNGSSASPTISSTETTTISSKPASGQTYTFTPNLGTPTLTSLGSSIGCVGSSITINGTNLSNATSVTIGGTSVSSITSNTATKIVAIIGNGTSGNVVVSTFGGTSNSLPFTVSSVAPGTVGTITGTVTACAGTSLTYNVSAVTNAINYAWTVPTGWNITNGQGTNSITVTAGSANQNGYVTVVASNGCGNSADVSQTITLNPVNAINGTGYTDGTNKTSGNIIVSNGSTTGYLKFDLSALSGATSVTGATLSLLNNGSQTGSLFTNYSVPLGNNDPMMASASTLNNAINNFSTYYSSGTWSAITNTPLSLDLNSGTQNANADILSRIITPAYLAVGLYRGGTNVYNFFGYSSGAKTPQLAITYGTVRRMAVIVNALPTAILSGGSQTICSGSSANLTVTLTGKSPWTIIYNDGTTPYSSTANATPYTLAVSPVANNGANNPTPILHTYTLGPSAVTDGNGCVSNTTSGNASVTVKALSSASFGSAAYSTCFGINVSLALSGTPATTITYQINGSGSNTTNLVQNGTSGSGSITTNNLPVGNTTYTLTGITAASNTCAATLNNSAIVTVQALPAAPTVTALNSDFHVQTGANLQLSSNTLGGVWLSDNTTAATVNSSTGLVSGNTSEGMPTITYTINDNTALQCKNKTTQIVRVYNPDYITQASGNFSSAATWQIDRDDNTFVTSVPVPSGTNYTSIRVQNALTLDQDFQVGSGKSFWLITGGTMDVAAGKTFSSMGSVDFGGKLVTVKSDATGTGAIGQMASAIANASNVQVERFIGSSNFATGRRAWRLLTAPVTGVTINNAWQEGLVSTANPPVVGNTTYGTLITGYTQGTAATAFSHGYDFWDAIANSSSSIRYYIGGAVSGTWSSLPGNGLQGLNVEAYPAYMLFVRGNRSTLNTGFSLTTLRARGALKQGTKTTTVSGTNAYTVVGNPYASPIDFEKIYTDPANSGIIQPQFLVWNSQNGNYGSYTLVQRNSANNYTAVPNKFNTGGTGTASSNQYIVSGQGFLVQPNAGGTLTINEGMKTSSASSGINPYRISPETDKRLYVNLNLKGDTSEILADGLLARFDASYTGDIDEDDALKQANFNENLGISSNATDLIIEARPEAKNGDTLKLKLWNVTQRNYQLQLMAENFATSAAAGLHAYVEDKYLGTKQEADLAGGITSVDFSVNSDAASYAQDRFRIVFGQSSVLPVMLTSVKAAAQNGGVNVSWTVTNEVNMKQYTVERSTDGGQSYTAIAAQNPKNASGAAFTSYQNFDAQPQKGDNLYRIRLESGDGKITYSGVVKVTTGEGSGNPQITLYPNPVRKDGKINLQLTNLAADSYLVSIYSGEGKIVYQKKVTITQNNSTASEELRLDASLAQGIYPLHITGSKGETVYTDKLIVGK